MLRQSICQSPFVTRSSCYNSSNALFSRWPPSSTTLTNTNFSTHDCLLIRLSPLSIPLSFLIAPPRTCSTTIRGHGHSQTFFPRNYSTEGPRTNWWAARPIEVPRSFWPVGTYTFSQHCLWSPDISWAICPRYYSIIRTIVWVFLGMDQCIVYYVSSNRLVLR